MTKATENQLIEKTKQLVSIESTANNPEGLHEAYEFMVKMLLECAKTITIEHFEKNGKPSLLAYSGPHRPDNFRVILNGHIDVVPGKPKQFKPELKNGKLYGRGVYDMKAAAVIMTSLFCEYVDKVPYALGLQIVTDEESAGHDGTGHQVANGVRADFVICGECGRKSDRYEVANEAKGVLIADVEFAGVAAHGAYLWRGENAVLRATKFTHELLTRYPIPSEEVGHTTVNVSSLNTDNSAHTKVPDRAVVKLEIRFTNDDPNFRSKQHFAALVEEIDPNAVIGNIYAFDQPLFSSPKNPLLLQLKAAAEKVEGHEFKLVKRHATSDGRYYGNVGDQACEFGLAGEDQHGDNEHVSIQAFKNYHRTLDLFLENTVTAEVENTNTKAYVAA